MRSNIPSPSRSSPPSTCSAGNLFGTTRRSHPGAFACVPLDRIANTSGGVSSSWPGQNGQYSSRNTSWRSRRKSVGRLRRSVEMMTQRPVTASLRSSGTLVDVVNGFVPWLEIVHREGVPEDLDHRAWPIEVNRDHVEAARTVRETVSDHIPLRELRETAALPEVDRLRRV